MNVKSFLTPFGGEVPTTSSKGVCGSIEFTGSQSLILEFEWSPSQSSPSSLLECREVGERRDGLWQSTCFESFLQIKGNPAYWEINVSPEGQWNVYHFSGYRNPSPPQPDLTWKLKDFLFSNGGDIFLLRAEFIHSLKPLTEVQVGLMAILDDSPFQKNEQKTYWALKHASGKPDFHQTEGRQLERTSL